MKKIIFLMILIQIALLLIIQVEANSAPPINISITISNIDDHYDIDLLIPFERSLNELDISEAQTVIKTFEDDSYGRYYQSNFPTYLIDFQDQDGFVSNTLYGDSDHFYRNLNDIGLYTNLPRYFKIVLINSDNQLLISEVVMMEAYDQSFIWDLKDIIFDEDIQYNVGDFTGLNVNPFGDIRQYQELVIRIVFTIILEFLIFYMMGYRLKQTYLKFGMVNIVSQTLLTLGLIYGTFIGNGMFGYIIWLIIGELIVFSFEMGLNGLIIREKYTAYIVFSTFLANLASLIFGTIITLELYKILW